MGGRHHPHIAMSHGVLRGPRGQHYEKENGILGFPLPSTNPPNFLTYQLYSPLHTYKPPHSIIQDLFLESNSKRTVVMLPGVKLAHLRTLLGFIYTGEVKVSEDELPDLLEVAEMLGVRGLKANNSDEDEDEEDEGEQQEAQLREDGESKNILQEGVIEKQTDIPKNLAPTPLKPQTPEPHLLKTELPKTEPPNTPVTTDEESEQILEEAKENGETPEDPLSVKSEPTMAPPAPKPSYAGLQSQYGYMAPYMSPLVSMSNLAAMYQQVSS